MLRKPPAGGLLGVAERHHEVEVLDRGREVTALGQQQRDDPGQGGQLGSAVLLDGSEHLLEHPRAVDRPLGLEHAAREQDQGAEVLGIFLEDLAERGLGRLGLPLADLHDRLAGEQPGVSRLLAKPLVEGLDGRLGLPALVKPLRLVGVRLDLVAAPLEFLTAAARARGIRLDAGHRYAFLTETNSKSGTPGCPGSFKASQ